MKNAWAKKRLGDVVTRLTNGYVGPTRNIYLESGVPYLLARHVRDNQLAFDGKTFVSDEFNLKHKKSMLKAGDVLLVQSGHIGHSAVVSEEHEGHNCHAMIVITPVKDAVTGRFLSLYFNSPRMQEGFDKIRSGSTVPHLTCRAVKEVSIPLPPLPEQRRIVGILDEACDGIATARANAEKNLQNARALFESHLQAVFTNAATQYPTKRLKGLCERITKGSSPKWQGISYVDQPGVLFVTSENVQEHRVVIASPKYVEEKFNDKDKRSILKRGDVLTNLVGASIGRTAVFELDDNANINQAVGVVTCVPDLLHNYYLMFLFNSPFMKRFFHDNEVNNARANISLTFLKELHIPLPSVECQKSTVAQIREFHEQSERLESIYQRKLAALDELKKSLLHQAFSGNLSKTAVNKPSEMTTS